MTVVHRLAWTAVAATLLLIALGGLVRATDSGLACPDWPACYGQWIPPADLRIWFEHGHRLWAGVVLLLILALTLVTRRHDRRLFALSLATLGLVLVQAALGALVVLLLLRAGLVTAHLLTSFAVVALLVTIAVGASSADPARHLEERQVGRWAAVVAGLVLAQAVLGAQGTGQGIAYVFNAVPMWLAGDAWTGDTRQLLHLVHRIGGYVVAAAVLALTLAVQRRAAIGGVTRPLALLTRGAAVLVVVQVALGLANALTRGAPWSATAHLAVASWIWTCLVAAAAVALRPSPVASSLGTPRRARARRLRGHPERPAGSVVRRTGAS